MTECIAQWFVGRLRGPPEDSHDFTFGRTVAIIGETGVDPRRLGLEITESAIMDNPKITIGTLKQLKALGIELSFDDFGTGYSSLCYLKRFPIDKIKIDQSFIRDISTDASDEATACRRAATPVRVRGTALTVRMRHFTSDSSSRACSAQHHSLQHK